MSEIVLQGYVQAAGNPPLEPTSKTTGSCGLYIAFTFPNQNDDLDPDGLPQPILPPIEIQYVEVRYTYDDRAATDWTDIAIVWSPHQKVLTSGPTAKLEDPNQPYDPVNNTWLGLQGSLAIRPLNIKSNIYFQLRSISRSGVPSDWSDVIKLSMNPDPGEPSSQPQQSLDKMPCREGSVIFMPANNI